MNEKGRPNFSRIQLFSPMICVLVHVLCHLSPFYTKKDCKAKVPAETQCSFRNFSIQVHQVSRSDLGESWKTWARENYRELAAAVVHPTASAKSNEQTYNEMAADMMARIGASPR